MAGEFRGRGKDSNVRHIIGECNCRFLDALAGEFKGRGKESNVRHIFRECNGRFLDALAGEFRCRGKESNVRHIIGMQLHSARRIGRRVERSRKGKISIEK